MRLLPLASVLVFTVAAFADGPEPLASMARLPVKEVTVFKDGHAFILHSGTMPTDTKGDVLLDYLPNPVLGTFWPYSADKNVKLSAVTASQRKVVVSRTSLTLRELIEGNIGAAVVVTELPAGAADKNAALVYPATIVSVPTRSAEELEATSPPNTGERLPEKGNIVCLKTAEGNRFVGLERILDVTFKEAPQSKLQHEEFRNLLKLKLDWPADTRPGKDAAVGLMYLQLGLRWIPSYKVTIDGAGNASVQMQATLVNELADLDDVTANLVIGVPTFAFKDQNDPISLQQTIARLSNQLPLQSQMMNFSNAIQSQAAYSVRGAEEPAGPRVDLGPEIAGSSKSEDLFIFTVKHITLKKGQRMVLPVTDFRLKYRDVYALDIPFTPPPEVWRDFGSRPDMASLFAAPKAMHKLRLSNSSSCPLTTAPALILRDDRVVAQGMMTYTAIGAESDLDLTTAVDISAKKTDVETRRVPNAVQWNGEQYGRIDLAGTITLTNFGRQPVEIEVMRHVLGNVDSADNSGKLEMVNVFEDVSFTPAGAGGVQPWWVGYSWPYWWRHLNGVGRVTWTLTLAPDKPVQVGYAWHYYWR